MMKSSEPAFTVVVSTVGTSLLTNGVMPEQRTLLTKTANFRAANFPTEMRSEVDRHIEERRVQMRDAAPAVARRMSAELNSILAQEALGSRFHHYLLHTDTYQGAATAEMVRDWLQNAGVASANVVCLSGLTTARQEDFDAGMDSLLNWCHETLPACRDQGAQIVFNPVGGFKSFQAYVQMLGMLYADESVYLFEGDGATPIRIPKIPLQFDETPLRENAALLARLVHGHETVPVTDVASVPDVYLERAGDYAGVSYWGKVAWFQVEQSILGQELLAQPGIAYSEGFKKDFENAANLRIALQQAVAKTSVLYAAGGLQKLRGDGGLQYETYNNRGGIGHFRINQGDRISCIEEKGVLQLRHFGAHDYVNKNP